MQSSPIMLRRIVTGLLLLVPAFCSASAHGQLVFTLNTPQQTGLPGQILTFSGMLQNTGAQQLFLNGDTFSLNGTGLTVDDTEFLIGAPVSLAANQTFSGTFFNVLVSANAPVVSAAAGSFSILGGANNQAFNTLASANFQVSVAPIPEPSSLAILMTTLPIMSGVGMGLSVWRRRRASRI